MRYDDYLTRPIPCPVCGLLLGRDAGECDPCPLDSGRACLLRARKNDKDLIKHLRDKIRMLGGTEEPEQQEPEHGT